MRESGRQKTEPKKLVAAFDSGENLHPYGTGAQNA
jgi:hypothetical protein